MAIGVSAKSMSGKYWCLAVKGNLLTNTPVQAQSAFSTTGQ